MSVSTVAKPRSTLSGHRDGVTCVVIVGEHTMYSSSYDNTIREWNLHTLECVRTLFGHEHTVWHLAYDSNTPDTLYSCARDCTVRTWEISSAQMCEKFLAHKISTRWLCVSGNKIYTAGDDCVAKEFSLKGSKPRVFAGHSGPVTSVFVSSGSIFTSSADHTVRQWSIERLNTLMTYSGHTGVVNCVAMNEKGALFSGSHDYTLREWAVDSGECVFVYKGHTFLVLCLAVAGRRLFSGSADATVREWDVETHALLRNYTAHEGYVWCLVVDDSRLFSASNDGTIMIWDIS